MIEKPGVYHYAILSCVLLSVGFSGPLIRLIEAGPLTIVWWRTALALPFVMSVAILRKEAWSKTAILAGILLCVHWIAWAAAVHTTSIASASFLVTTSPIWLALLSKPLLGEAIGKTLAVGIAIAAVGIAFLMTETQMVNHSLQGDALALFSAFCWVGYAMLGRAARASQPFWGYTASVYATAAVCTLPLMWFFQAPVLQLDTRTWWLLAALAAFPTLIGHGGMNYLFRFFHPAKIGLAVMTEPVLAGLVAWAWFAEPPTPRVFIGGTCVLIGVGLGIRGR